MFPKTHDELDFEFLGNIRGKPWRFQTNIYGNGSTTRGREERYRLWFDPSKEFHRYSIFWSHNKIIFYVDEIPIREVLHDENMEGDYPSKPMSSYATVWDASSWATGGGRHKVDYRFEPFTSEFQDLVLQGCQVDPTDATSTNCNDATDELESSEFATITPWQRQANKWFREKYMYYSYCYDRLRYPSPLPECLLVSSEQELFKNNGRLKKAPPRATAA
uniref:Xyloglucan endotransglucosylase/hydrolase n=1 Tax=Tanacetum cinerariifolium TaxID=118510 RepID=A0A6L2MKP2_TANCI|nr:probable xyloglucan endotransglucosylase/hydrolase protein 30 [Tanacetum cinerariifolium]